jgi:hypothetical protein
MEGKETNLLFFKIMKKVYLIFIGISAIMGLLLYFYPADIFQAITTYADGELTKDVTLKQLISQNTWPDSVDFLKNQSVNPTTKGWAMLLICFIGIPGLMAWRSTLTKYNRKTGEQEKSVYDKLKD